MQTDIVKMEVFTDTTVRCYYTYMDQKFQYYIEVHSTNPIFYDWDQQILTTGVAPSGEVLEFCMMVHHKVFKHIRKRLRKASSRLLRKVKYRKLFDAQNGLCYLCKGPLTVYDCTIDHVKPKSKGGKDSLRNILLTHSTCNTEKSNRMPTEQEMAYLVDVNEKVKQINYLKIE